MSKARKIEAEKADRNATAICDNQEETILSSKESDAAPNARMDEDEDEDTGTNGEDEAETAEPGEAQSLVSEAQGKTGADTAQVTDAGTCGADDDYTSWLIYRNYSFSRIAQSPSGSHFLIADASGVVHKAMPMEVMGKRALLVHKAEESEYAHAIFAEGTLE